jgi:heme exporter protein D
MNGLVSGGWSFVWAAYAITALVMATYAIRTFTAARGTHASR